MDLKGAVKMTVDYSDGSQTVVNYNPITGEALGAEQAPEAVVETPVDVVVETAPEAEVEVVVEEESI